MRVISLLPRFVRGSNQIKCVSICSDWQYYPQSKVHHLQMLQIAGLVLLGSDGNAGAGADGLGDGLGEGLGATGLGAAGLGDGEGDGLGAGLGAGAGATFCCAALSLALMTLSSSWGELASKYLLTAAALSAAFTSAGGAPGRYCSTRESRGRSVRQSVMMHDAFSAASHTHTPHHHQCYPASPLMIRLSTPEGRALLRQPRVAPPSMCQTCSSPRCHPSRMHWLCRNLQATLRARESGRVGDL